MDMTSACLSHERPFGDCQIRTGQGVGMAAWPAGVGRLAWVRTADVTALGITGSCPLRRASSLTGPAEEE